jgi:hypothetical protein
MFATGIDPFTGKKVYVARDPREKRLQRALLQYGKPENAPLVREALIAAHREDLIGTGKDCLVRPENSYRPSHNKPQGSLGNNNRSKKQSNGKNNGEPPRHDTRQSRNTKPLQSKRNTYNKKK